VQEDETVYAEFVPLKTISYEIFVFNLPKSVNKLAFAMILVSINSNGNFLRSPVVQKLLYIPTNSSCFMLFEHLRDLFCRMLFNDQISRLTGDFIDDLFFE
jgi:hypothetical protein